MTPKETAIELIQGMPTGVTIRYMLETIALRQMIEEGVLAAGELPEQQRIWDWIEQTVRA